MEKLKLQNKNTEAKQNLKIGREANPWKNSHFSP